MNMTIDQITKKSRYYKNGTSKLGNMLVFAKLYSDKEFFIPELDTIVKGTCGKYCHGCSDGSGCGDICYVSKEYRYPDVKLGHAYRTIAIRENLKGLQAELELQLKNKRIKNNVIRLNQSGEIERLDELIMHMTIAKKFPNEKFYIYTKAFDIVSPYILAHENELPDNLIILYSIYHEQGIKEFKEVRHIKTVKAFIILDGFDYSAYGIEIDTICGSYDKNGKLNKKVTCFICGKCFIISDNSKTIGCYEH